MRRSLSRGLSRLALAFVAAATAGCDDSKDPASASSDAGAVATVCPALDPACTTTEVPSYKAQVAPIIEKSCATGVGCHTGKAGDPWPLNHYQDIVDWKTSFVEDIQGCTMPPPDAGVAFSADDRLVLWQWLTCGTPNN